MQKPSAFVLVVVHSQLLFKAVLFKGHFQINKKQLNHISSLISPKTLSFQRDSSRPSGTYRFYSACLTLDDFTCQWELHWVINSN